MLYKTTFYTMTTEGIKKQNGYCDDKWCYYKGYSNNDGCDRWYIVDPMTGLSIDKDSSRDKAREKANSKEMLDKFNSFQKSETYTKYVNNFYTAQVEKGIIMVL